MSQFETVRPLHGLIGQVFADADRVPEQLLHSIAQGFDQGEGWVTVEPKKMTWNVGDLAVVVEVFSSEFEGQNQQYAEMTIEIVRDVIQVDRQLLKAINQLNSQSAGWVVWIDEDERKILCSIRVPLNKSQWWWVTTLWRVIPLAITMAEANARWLSDLSGGTVAVCEHPTLGFRDVRDSWIDGVLLGQREPATSLGLMITSLDLAQIREVLESRDSFERVVLSWPMTAALQDKWGATFAHLREHWHSEFGLGWQFTSIESVTREDAFINDVPTEEELISVARMNEKLMTHRAALPVFGGWLAVSPFNFIRTWFLPAGVIEEIQVLSQSSFGTVAGLMFVSFEETYARQEGLEIKLEIDQHNEVFEDAVHTLNLNNGFLVHSTLLSFGDEDANDNSWQMWLKPRHSLVCSFGIFNPVGPTVSSLELGLDGDEWVLYWVMRHPHGPEIVEVGTTPVSEAPLRIPELIENCLAETHQGVLGSGCHWMDIRLPQYAVAVEQGLRRFASASHDTDWRAKCQKVVAGQCDPWATLELNDSDLPEIDITDEISLWIELVTDPNVIFGHQAFVRSAWEGSKHFAIANFDTAQSTANSIMYGVRERLLDDFAFRESEGLLIQHPTS